MYIIVCIRENGVVLPTVACQNEREVTDYLNVQALYLGYLAVIGLNHFKVADIHYYVYNQLQPS